MNINPVYPSSLRRAAAALLLLAGAASMPDALCSDAPVPARPAATLSFNFSGQARPGMTTVARLRDGVPLYDPARGYGFVDQTSAMPARTVHTAGMRATGQGF